MSNSGLSVKDEELRELAYTSVDATYNALGTALAHDAFTVRIVNDMDVPAYISVDGTTNIKKLAAKSGLIIDYKTNDSWRKAGTIFYAKRDGTANEGGVWVEVEYT